MGLFYAFFHLFLRKLTFFQMNRVYLLATFLISFSIPLFQIEVESNATAIPEVREQVIQQMASSNNAENYTVPLITAPKTMGLNWQQITPGIYWLITAGVLGSLVIQLLKLVRHSREISVKHGSLKIIYKKTGFTNCSFLNYVFVDPEKLTNAELSILLQHEQVHVAELHTIDKLLLNLGKALLWFNPFIYLYDKALEQVHEYEADKKASGAIGTSPYAGLLLNIASRQSGPSLAHSFASNPVKERIQMLFTNQSKVMKKLFYLSVLPLAGVLAWLFAVQIVSASPTEKPKPIGVSTSVTTPILEKEDSIVTEEAEQQTTESKPQTSDTLWIVDPGRHGTNAKVTINGTLYDVDILTKISPRCLKTTRYSGDTVKITTHGKKIFYASEIDRENIITHRKALSTALDADDVYARFVEKNQDGMQYDYIFVVVASGNAIGINVDPGEEPLFLFDGIKYSEAEVKNMKRINFPGKYRMEASRISPENLAKYGDQYNTQIVLETIADSNEDSRE